MRPCALVTIAALLALAGCGGGGDGGGDATDLLNRAFAKPISSGRVAMDGQITVNGIAALRAPIRLKASGPFSSGSAGSGGGYDVDLKIGVGPGQTVDTGSLSTGDRSFVKFEDSWYELDPSQVRGNPGARSGRCGARALVRGARGWMTEARDAGTQAVDGVQTTHVSGRLDVRRALRGLSGFLGSCGRALGAGGRVPQALSARDLDRVASVASDPHVELYVGKRDGLIHRISTRLDLSVPARDRKRLGGLSGGSLELSVDLTQLNRPQRIEAPEDSRPIAELSRRLGGAAALSEGLKGLGGERPGGSALPGGTETTPSDPGGAAAPGAGADGDAFQRYSDCLDKANPESRTGLQRCSRLLRRSR